MVSKRALGRRWSGGVRSLGHMHTVVGAWVMRHHGMPGGAQVGSAGPLEAAGAPMGASGEEGAAAADAEDAGGGASAGHAPCAGLSERGAGGGSGSGCVQVLMTSL